MNKFGHVLNGVLVGVGLGVLLAPAGGLETATSVLAVTVPVTLGALLPDIDTEFGTHRKTLHNLSVLAGFAVFPMVFGNLQWVWVGVMTHLVLDMFGTTRGIAPFYPVSEWEIGFPTGVTTSSEYATVVTLVVTVAELLVAAFVVLVAPELGAGLDAALAELASPPGLL